jgi:hypothetical protein
LPSRFARFVRKYDPVDGSLPFTHATDAYTLREVVDTGRLTASDCSVFLGEKLLYFFLGRAAYRANNEIDANSLIAYAPICFVLSSKTAIKPKRIFPFDSGGFSHGLFAESMHHRMHKEDFQLDPDMSSPRRLINVFFETNKRYCDNNPMAELEISRMEFEAESFHTLITDRQRNTYDDRVSCIEIEVGHDVVLKGAVEAIVLPGILCDDAELMDKIKEWGATPLPYSVINRFKPSKYVATVAQLVRDYVDKAYIK